MSTLGKIGVAIGALLIAGVAAAIIYTLIQNNPSVPKFSVDSSNIDGWWASDNTNLQTMAKSMGSKYTGEEPIDKLPVSDLTIHHGDKDAKTISEDNCFTAFSYYDYPSGGLDAAYKEYENRKGKQGKLEVLDPIDQTLKTHEGDKSYELRQYNYTIEGQEVLSGYEVGFIELGSGYVRIEGVCKTANDLALTLPILQAVTLNEN